MTRSAHSSFGRGIRQVRQFRAEDGVLVEVDGVAGRDFNGTEFGQLVRGAVLISVVSRVRGPCRGRDTHVGLGGIGRATVQERRPIPGRVGLPHARSAVYDCPAAVGVR